MNRWDRRRREAGIDAIVRKRGSMKPKDLEFFSELLIQQRKRLIRQAGETMIGLTEAVESLADPADRASFETDRSFLFRIRDRESKLIKKIDAALQRIEDGTFGICEICEEEIGIGRLKARPVTTRCIACKSREEAMERAIGQ